MPRPKLSEPTTGALKKRRYRERQRSGRKVVRIGDEIWEVSNEAAKQIKRVIEALVWKERG